MKFQNPSFNFFFLNGRTNTQTHKRTSRKQYAPHFFKVGGIMKAQEWLQAKRSFFPDAQGQLTQQSLVEPG